MVEQSPGINHSPIDDIIVVRMMFVQAAGKRVDGVMPVTCRAIRYHRSRQVYTDQIMAGRHPESQPSWTDVKAKLTIDRWSYWDLDSAHKASRTFLQPVVD
jgi:hypothetical protein